MNPDDIRTALRALEAEQPDVASVQDDLRLGIDRRARRRRIGGMVGATAAVALVAAGAVTTTALRGTDNAHEASPTVSVLRPGGLVPVTVPGVTLPVNPGPAAQGRTRSWTLDGDTLWVSYDTGLEDHTGFDVVITEDRPGDVRKKGQPGRLTEQQTTIGGHPAVIRTDPEGLTDPQLTWQLPDKQWVSVSSHVSLQVAKGIAASTTYQPQRLSASIDIGLAPSGYRPSYVQGSELSPWQADDMVMLCPGDNGDDSCFQVSAHTGRPLADAPEGTPVPASCRADEQPTGPSDTPSSPVSESPTSTPETPTPTGTWNPSGSDVAPYAPVRHIGTASVRISVSGCSAVKLTGGDRYIQVTAPDGSRISTGDLAELAASATAS